MTWYIRGALGGGFGGVENADWIATEAENEEQAMRWAEEEARQEYESYEGSNGLFDHEEYMEENPESTDADADAEREQDIDSWIDFDAKEFEEDPNAED